MTHDIAAEHVDGDDDLIGELLGRLFDHVGLQYRKRADDDAARAAVDPVGNLVNGPESAAHLDRRADPRDDRLHQTGVAVFAGYAVQIGNVNPVGACLGSSRRPRCRLTQRRFCNSIVG